MLKGVLPAVRNMKDFENIMKSNHDYIIFLETRVSQVSSLVKHAKNNKKKVLVHADLIQGLKTDEYGFEFLIRFVKPDGIISTRGNIISLAKRKHILAVQRLFALDSQALENNIAIINKLKPDYIEVLPGIIPTYISEVQTHTNIPVIAGGLIHSKEDIENAFHAGAKAVTTSRVELWGLTKEKLESMTHSRSKIY